MWGGWRRKGRLPLGGGGDQGGWAEHQGKEKGPHRGLGFLHQKWGCPRLDGG